MAKKQVVKQHPGVGHKCRECAHHYGECSPAHDGHLILCRCPFKKDGGKFCIFMNDDACERYKAQ